MPPWDLSNSLLDYLVFRPGLCKRAHIEQIGSRQPLHFGKRCLQVTCEAIDHLRAPALLRLPCQDIAPDRPVEPYEFAIDDYGCPELRQRIRCLRSRRKLS